MADVFHAYKFLNDALKLKLSDAELARAEASFRKKFMEEAGYKAKSADIGNWEFFAHVGPRKDFSRPELAPKGSATKKQK